MQPKRILSHAFNQIITLSFDFEFFTLKLFAMTKNASENSPHGQFRTYKRSADITLESLGKFKSLLSIKTI